MSSTVYLQNSTGIIHLVNTNSGIPVPGGDPSLPSDTPFGVVSDWTPADAEPPDPNIPPDYRDYEDLEETIPLVYVGTSVSGTRDAERQLRQAAHTTTSPTVLYVSPSGSLAPGGYYEIGRVLSVRSKPFPNTRRSPAEGATTILIDFTCLRSPFAGAASLQTLLSGAAYTNGPTGNVQSLGVLNGDLIYDEGQPLNITIAKPASQTAHTLYLATVHSRQSATINNAVTTTSSAGATFTASGSIDLSALRTRAGLKLRTLARVKTLTAPSKAQVRITVSAAGGSVLWVSPWISLDTNTTAQLLDMQGIGLDMLRSPLANTSNVTIQGAIRSTDGTSVTATLDYLEALLYYDFCTIEQGGLASGQRYQLLGAQNLSGGGWQPLIPEQAKVVTAADAEITEAVLRQSLVRAFADSSLYLAWMEDDGGHTATDTTSVSAGMASLYRSLRGIA
jgi:hypothetical protein